MRCPLASRNALPVLLLSSLPAGVLGGDILSSNGFTTCANNPDITVNRMNVQFDRSTRTVIFDVSGTSSKVQNVTGSIYVTAYGQEVYSKTDFSPCDPDTYVSQLCPVPAGTFSAVGNQTIPQQYIDMIPSIAFNVPDLDGQAKVELKSAGDGTELACIESNVGNGQTMSMPAVTYVAAGVAAAALAMSMLSAVAAGGHPGASTSSPSFGEVIGWFQGIACNGMLSVQYPAVYQSFAQNFAFSTGIIPWGDMQNAIDSFRSKTGGNLTDDNYPYLQNVTIVTTASGNSSGSSIFKRAVDNTLLWARDVTTSVNGTTATFGDAGSNATSNGTNISESSKAVHYVSGIQAYVEQLMVPQANTFMTVLLVFACVVAFITVMILLAKVILEAFALMTTLPKSLESWRKRYWWRLAKALTNLILLLYGTWTLYCLYQFTNGDSWAAKTLAAVTWTMFTATLAFFTFKIYRRAHQFKSMNGDASQLFENKEVWLKYSLFYDSMKKGYWWLFVPSIIYMFARNAVIAGADGHGMVQAIGQMAVEVIFLILLIWTRPYNLRSGNVINIVIQVVRVLSVICILVFVEELGISQTTKTITGVILIVVQSVLTGVLAILIAVNALINCIKENPHRRRRKDAEKMNRDIDNLTPLDARNSLLISSPLTEYKGRQTDPGMTKAPLVSTSLHTTTTNTTTNSRYDPVRQHESSPPATIRGGRPRYVDRAESRENLVSGAASMGGRDRDESPVPSYYSDRRPRLPAVDFGHSF
ncbi:hypothetical protein MBLNU457_2354t1 [Dothideomycetes sp. NU457]